MRSREDSMMRSIPEDQAPVLADGRYPYLASSTALQHLPHGVDHAFLILFS